MAYTKNVWVDQNVQRPKTYEVTNNADGSVTLTDSFGVVTEIGTPVNAVNMNHIEEGVYNNDANITTINGKIPSNASSSNKMAVASDIAAINTALTLKADKTQLHALKGYSDNGELLTDAEGLADVKSYAHSTFDRSKFTVIGTPNITKDGIASGFSSSNNLYTTLTQTATNSITVKQKFICKNLSNSEGFLYHINKSGVGEVYLVCTNSYIQVRGSNSLAMGNGDLNLSDGDVVETETTIGLNSQSFKAWVNGVALNPKSATKTFSSVAFDTCYIGTIVTGQYATTCSIDLKQFSITVDGVEVFSGNKTGLDTIKPDDYTVVGTPTISADGVANFTTNTALNLSAVTSTIDWSKDWDIEFEFDNSNSAGSITPISGYNQGFSGLQIGAGYNNGVIILVSSEGSGWQFNGGWQQNILPLSKCLIRINHTTDTYKIYADNVLKSTLTSNVNIKSGYQMRFGSFYDGTSPMGKTDLNAFKIYVDGNLVYQPCLKIPYTESKTGSKIVNAIYRDRVNDMAEQFGFAPYYTLSDSDFTLPQVELYGYINKLDEKRLDKDASNATQTAKNTIMNWLPPDYSNAISFNPSTGDEIDFDGWLIANLIVIGAGNFGEVKINNITVARSYADAQNGGYAFVCNAMVKKGDTLTFSGLNTPSCAFYKVPFSGGTI